MFARMGVPILIFKNGDLAVEMRWDSIKSSMCSYTEYMCMYKVFEFTLYGNPGLGCA